jgi:glycosyltransferase involved in cell wall biosynthesis
VNPLVSCVLPTADRPGFLRQAIRCFERQSYPEKELVIVDDGAEPAAEGIPDDPRIRYLRLAGKTPLGTKLNLGIEAARGDLLQKLDDDDYYHPRFLARTVETLRRDRRDNVISGLDCFLVLIAQSGELRFSGHGWFTGATFCFRRSLWRRHPFRDLPRAVDWWFLRDHQPYRLKICEPELLIVVRHQAGHTWRRLGKTDVTEYFRRRRPWGKPLERLLPADDLPFYRSLRQKT